MALRGTQRAIIGAVAIGLASVVVYVKAGDRSPVAGLNGTRSTIAFPTAAFGGKPADADLVCAICRGDCDRVCLNFLKLDAGIGVESTDLRFRSCDVEWDGGLIPELVEDIKEHLMVERSTCREVTYDGGPKFVGYINASAAADWECACSPATGNCEFNRIGRRGEDAGWVAGTNLNFVFGEGRWRGSDCVRTPCEQGITPNYPDTCVR